MRSLLDAIRADEETAAFLDWPGDLDLNRTEHVEEVHLESGATLEPFAGDGAGGTYFFCGDGGEERPILYADSEGSAALIAVGVPELLTLLLVAPWWQDAQWHPPAALAAQYLADIPELPARRDRAAEALGLTLPPQEQVLERLREVATGLGREYVLIFTPENNQYQALITG